MSRNIKKRFSLAVTQTVNCNMDLVHKYRANQTVKPYNFKDTMEY